jgi:hypothetical protein
VTKLLYIYVTPAGLTDDWNIKWTLMPNSVIATGAAVYMITCKIFDMYLFLQLAVSVNSMQVFFFFFFFILLKKSCT